MSSSTSLVTTRHMASTYRRCVITIVISCLSIMGDREAVKESGLSKLVEKLPGLLYCIGDCVYTPTEHLIPIYGSDNATKS